MGKKDSSLNSNSNWSLTVLDSIADGVFTIDDNFRITSFNQAAQVITGFSREEAMGKLCNEVFNANICKNNCALRKTLETETELINVPIDITTKDGTRLPISVSTAILKNEDGENIGGVESFRDLSVIEKLKKQLQNSQSHKDHIGLNSSLAHIANVLPDISTSDATVLITGPSGTGKGMIAEIIHNMSPRKGKPFVKVSCAALPENLLESELFGYEKGAFTDAKTKREGRVATAEGGTLFLDEIGEIPLPIQVKLLRFIQEKEYEPLGSSQTQKADVRILTATHRDLQQRIAQGEFRQDLFYRLNIVSIELPPLNERKDDIPAFIHHFVSKFNHRYKKNIEGVSDDTMQLFLNYNYPGNIREFENAMEHAFVLCKGTFIEPHHLPARFLELKEQSRLITIMENESPFTPREQLESKLIYDVLKKHKGNKLKVSEELQMHRSTLWRKIKRYNIDITPMSL